MARGQVPGRVSCCCPAGSTETCVLTCVHTHHILYYVFTHRNMMFMCSRMPTPLHFTRPGPIPPDPTLQELLTSMSVWVSVAITQPSHLRESGLGEIRG